MKLPQQLFKSFSKKKHLCLMSSSLAVPGNAFQRKFDPAFRGIGGNSFPEDICLFLL